jgi:hypothetical protein
MDNGELTIEERLCSNGVSEPTEVADGGSREVKAGNCNGRLFII